MAADEYRVIWRSPAGEIQVGSIGLQVSAAQRTL
jgi:hypothetical protein